jgi:hypothetical protein
MKKTNAEDLAKMETAAVVALVTVVKAVEAGNWIA